MKPLSVVVDGLEKGTIDRAALPLKVIVVRDTWTNLERSTIATLKELEAGGLQVQWANDGKDATLAGGLVTCHFMGVERAADVNKFQGFGGAVLWIEEPAPAADISGGVAPEVFGVGISSLRQRGVPHWCQISMNPPDEDHWTITIEQTLRARQKQGAPISVAVFEIPPGENRHLSDSDRERNLEALMAIGRGDLVARLVKGQVGQIVLGEPVIPEYNDRNHVAEAPLPILPGVDLIRGWDFGLTPCCVFSQVTPSGHWHILDVVQGENMGLEQLIEQKVLPWQAYYLEGMPFAFRDIGDPAGTQREQRDSEQSAVLWLNDRLTTSFEPAEVEWGARRNSLKAVFTRMTRGTPVVRVDPQARWMRRVLRGGWHYPKDALGRITPTLEACKRASGIYSHAGDALGYCASKLYPVGTLEDFRVVRTPIDAVPRPASPHAWMGV